MIVLPFSVAEHHTWSHRRWGLPATSWWLLNVQSSEQRVKEIREVESAKMYEKVEKQYPNYQHYV